VWIFVADFLLGCAVHFLCPTWVLSRLSHEPRQSMDAGGITKKHPSTHYLYYLSKNKYKGVNHMATTATAPNKGASAARTRGIANAEPLMLRKRIGSTNFIVNVRFSDKQTETLEDKILRLIEREVSESA
jgi:hypothetical protein